MAISTAGGLGRPNLFTPFTRFALFASCQGPKTFFHFFRLCRFLFDEQRGISKTMAHNRFNRRIVGGAMSKFYEVFVWPPITELPMSPEPPRQIFVAAGLVMDHEAYSDTTSPPSPYPTFIEEEDGLVMKMGVGEGAGEAALDAIEILETGGTMYLTDERRAERYRQIACQLIEQAKKPPVLHIEQQPFDFPTTE